MASEENEEDRRQIIGRLEYRYKELKAERQQAEADIDQQAAEIEKELSRAKNPPAGAQVCIRCWVGSGIVVQRESIPHPDEPGRYDRWRCPTCDHFQDRRTGMR